MSITSWRIKPAAIYPGMRTMVGAAVTCLIHYTVGSSTVLLLTLGATFNDVSKATNLQQAHRDLSDTTYSQTDALATALLSRVNKERVAHGLPVICSNKKLQAAAQRHVKDQSKSDFMSDFGTDDSTPEKRVADAGYKWERVAENIDSTNADVDAVVDWWMKTQSRDNLLGNFTMIGSAYAYNENTSSKYFWVQVYATGSLEECDGHKPAMDVRACL
ncbi:hypothetical protein DD237_002397 [Peronospora effusa]|uniref:SCP domain-containing protein n=1 Tax=Peronospora effusa TaxID=542832 RepID=A0A3R7XZP9_9STRA|nr:hypothetical protein DD237_002397 [Peronospora effusa]